jgi:predicted adenine nucleotide alpha hydrolase (AANH) superfamily ATPase
LDEFLQGVVFREAFGVRCQYCYHKRLEATAQVAKHGKFDAFTTTLLYSKFQNHKLICDIAASLSKEYGVRFYYEDFRLGWKEGIEVSKKLGMYRQQYCGCIYSERDRYAPVQKKEGASSRE